MKTSVIIHVPPCPLKLHPPFHQPGAEEIISGFSFFIWIYPLIVENHWIECCSSNTACKLPCVCVCLCVSADDSLLRQEDIWMLDGDDPHEPLSRVPRPDHLDFLRITPPEDDIIGDTPYCPKLECTVSSANTKCSCHAYLHTRSTPFSPPRGTQGDFSPLRHLITWSWILWNGLTGHRF